MEYQDSKELANPSNWQNQSNIGIAGRELCMGIIRTGAAHQNISYKGSSDSSQELKPTKTVNSFCPPTYRRIINNEFVYKRFQNARLEQELDTKLHESDAPTDQDEIAVLIHELWDAFYNMEGIVDKPCKGGKICQAGQRLMSGYYPPEAVEIACWKIFDTCRIAALGIHLVENYHNARFETEHQTFMDRWERIVEGCRVSKALCKQVLDPDFVHRLCDAPDHELKAKNQNKVINTARDLQNSIGRAMLKLKNSEGSDNHDIQLVTEETGISSSTPRHTSTCTSTSILKTPTTTSVSAALTSTGKRKMFEELGLGGSDSGDNKDGDYESDTQDTPIKSKRAHTSARFSRTNPISSTGTSRFTTRLSPKSAAYMDMFISEAEAKSEHQLSSSFANKPKGPSSAQPMGSISGVTTGRLHSRLEYKEMVCDILNVSRQFAQTLDLYDLRFYARAYNMAFINKEWIFHDKNTNKYRGKQYCLFSGSGYGVHFALVIQRFKALAIERGDLKDETTVSGETIKNSIDVGGNENAQKALGMINNNFMPILTWEDENPVVSGGSRDVISTGKAHASFSVGSSYINGRSALSDDQATTRKHPLHGFDIDFTQNNLTNGVQAHSIDPTLSGDFYSGHINGSPPMNQSYQINPYSRNRDDQKSGSYSYASPGEFMDFNGDHSLYSGIAMEESRGLAGFDDSAMGDLGHRDMQDLAFMFQGSSHPAYATDPVRHAPAMAGGSLLPEVDRRTSHTSADIISQDSPAHFFESTYEPYV